MSNTLSLPELAAKYASEDFTSIPVIDLGGVSNGNPAVRREIATKIQKACLTAGFFYVVNHGVDETLVEEAFTVSKEFFEQPKDVKASVDSASNRQRKGWSDVLRAKTAEDRQAVYAGDLMESFDLGMTKDISSRIGIAQEVDLSVLGENVWPDQSIWTAAEQYRHTLTEHFAAVLALGRRLLPLFALALNLPEDFFDDKTTMNFANQRMLYYPALEGRPADPSQPGIAAHTDWQMFTILRQDMIGGLEVRNLAGDWLQATPIPHSFVINIGNQLSRWTNYVFKSTSHRVQPPPAFVPRQSSPMFWGADPEAVLEPLSTCVSESRPFLDPVITAGQHVQQELDRIYAAR